MALITPYGDPNAHGSLGNSVSFRRSRGKVVFQAKPFPTQPNTSAQIAQRNAFASAQNDWYSYNAISKGYYNIRGPELGMSAKNLYTQAKLLNNMPNQVHQDVKEIVQAQIITTICPGPGIGQIDFATWDSIGTFWLGLGNIQDDDNVLNAQPAGASTYTKFRITFWTDTYDLWRYGVWLQVRQQDNSLKELIVRCRSPKDPGQMGYVTKDGSFFDDDARTELNATNNF